MFKNDSKMLYSMAPHSAFTDLCNFSNTLFCSFRAATDHISPDGKIVILQLDWQGDTVAKNMVRMLNCDLRDPKLSVSTDGKLILLFYARHSQPDGTFLYSQPYVCFSQDGASWSSPKAVGQKNHWLWRLRWYGDKALGFAYNRRQQILDLYAGNPLRTFEKLLPEALSQRKHHRGYPNESDIGFDSRGTAYAIVRRDADSGMAQWGIAKPPYKQWHWQDLGFYIGGPVMLMLDDQQALLCGRIWQEHGPKTALIKLNLINLEANIVHILPSGGDCSYPGLVKQGDDLYISYYSSHIDNHSRIYLSHLSLADINAG
ncbi:hypothetical protein [Neptunicella sp. SCSIO 80796]|uniref:hypothetical protein n=1 Tax=Neptunicella plasticusilytica TaxID=3117012 RepID=UPI003A4DE546